MRACRAATRLPLWVKLSPNVADLAAIARAAERGGADALVLTNTLRGLAIDHWTLEPLLGGVTGGLSGPALKPVALAAVHTCREACALPLVGVGGIAERLGCPRISRCGRKRRAGRERGLQGTAARPADPTRNLRPYSLSAAWRALGH